MSDNVSKLRALILNSGDIAGSAIAGALGFVAGGPVGAGVGAAAGTFIGKVVTKVGSDIHDSYLSPKEEARIGAGVAIALSDIKRRLEAGEQLRNDGFFESKSDKRSDAEDILEGMLLKCKATYEEKKVHYSSKFFSNISFQNDIDVNRACYYLQVFEKLTYRQLCLLNIFNRVGNTLRSESLTGKNGTPEQWLILQEIQDLKDLNLVYQGDADQKVTTVWGLGELVPAYLYGTAIGHELGELFSLSEISDSDLTDITRLLL
ncbi:hypothetical protein [Psychromonas ossibalaenae]|uniref:hypothetical protein n=1 Tax=Psychromonas ossibalaenae TaxID=444922 RepID=UPI00036786A6|nr:hypothetical protein [Psychromonas ossibalaenae]